MIFTPQSESNRKDDPPKLTLRPDLGPPMSNRSRQRNRPSGMPELKRIKKEDHKVVGAGAMEPGELPRSPSPAPSSHNSDDPPLNHTDKIKVRKIFKPTLKPGVQSFEGFFYVM